jgi:hypothetical protein
VVEFNPTDSSRSKLRYDGKTFDEWSELLATELSAVGLTQAVQALAAFGAHGFASDVADALLAHSSRLDGVGDEVLLAFMTMPRDQSVPKLLVAAKSKDAAIRRAAITVLGRVVAEPQEFTALFEQGVSDLDASVRRIALLSLASTAPQGEEIKRALKLALHDSDPLVVSSAASVMLGNSYNGNIVMEVPPLPELAEDLVPLLTDEELQKRDLSALSNTVAALARCGPAAKVAIPAVIPWLAVAEPTATMPDPEIRCRYALTIIKAAGPKAGDAQVALAEYLKACVSRAQELRGQLGSARGYAIHALELLSAIGPPPQELVPVLIDSIEKDSPNRVAIIRLLGHFGPDAAAAVPLLQRILDTPGISIDQADAAREALTQIQPETK